MVLMERKLPTPLNNGVTELCAVVDELMLAMYASAMDDFLVDNGILRDLARANAWLEHAVFLSFEPRGELQ